MEDTMQENKDKLITITNCNTVTLNGVDHIIGFDERCVILSCDFGRVVIEGENMKVESLIKENGEICIVGKFKGVYLSEEKKGETILKKLFKW
jgi:sporulation protein YabP